jgi:hypothetical protein
VHSFLDSAVQVPATQLLTYASWLSDLMNPVPRKADRARGVLLLVKALAPSAQFTTVDVACIGEIGSLIRSAATLV